MWPKKIFDFFLFSSLFISIGAVLMCVGTTIFLLNKWPNGDFLGFVFFSTMGSYNLHWYLSTDLKNKGQRNQWSLQNRQLQCFLYLFGLCGSVFFGLYLLQFWIWLGLAAFLTFLYTAPKIPYGNLIWLKRIAYGKTIYLALVWTYVTGLLPLVVSNVQWNTDFIWLMLSRFFLIYANCILFDLRDGAGDKKEGIRSIITYLDEKGIDILFACSLGLFLGFSLMAKNIQNGWSEIGALVFPGLILAGLYPYFKKSKSDYVYYFLLDGLLILSSMALIVLQCL